MITNIPNQPVIQGDYCDIQYDEYYEQELSDEKCSDCGTYMLFCYRASKNNDGAKEYTCPGCGLTESE